MLVKLARRLRAGDDAGSAIVVVLVVMLVLTIGGLAVASVVTATTGMLSGARGTTQSRAAADAGLADAVGTARRTGNFCALTLTSTSPTYSVTSSCAGGQVTFTSTGSGGSGGSTKAQAVYAYTSGSTGHGADMVFYGDTTFTKEVITSNSNGLLSIVIPSGGFTCQVHVPANIVASGTIKTNGGCTIDGNVRAGGLLTMTNTTDVIKGNAIASNTGSYNLQGQILGDITVGGPIGFGWNGFTYPGNVSARGIVNLTSASIAGALTLPSSAEVDYDGWQKVVAPTATSPRVAGGISWQASVPVPPAPSFDPWFSYTYKPADWQPFNGTTFAQIKLVNSGTGPWTCARFMQNNPSTGNAAGWRETAALTTPTIIDATACGTLSANNGSNPNVALNSDIVFVAKAFDLTTTKFTSANSTKSRVWFVVNDGVSGSASPSCTNGAGNVVINGTDMSGVIAMAYTPCTVSIGGNSGWTGAFYGGGFSYGGGMTFVGASIALPGMPSSATMPGTGTSTGAALGALVSRRDLP